MRTKNAGRVITIPKMDTISQTQTTVITDANIRDLVKNYIKGHQIPPDLQNIPIGNWNVSKVTNMDFMFSRATSFNQPLNNWNVSNVTSMANMFNGATSFMFKNKPIEKQTVMPPRL